MYHIGTVFYSIVSNDLTLKYLKAEMHNGALGYKFDINEANTWWEWNGQNSMFSGKVKPAALWVLKRKDTSKVAKFCYWDTSKTYLMPTNAAEVMRNVRIPWNTWKQTKTKPTNQSSKKSMCMVHVLHRAIVKALCHTLIGRVFSSFYWCTCFLQLIEPNVSWDMVLGNGTIILRSNYFKK